MGKHVYFYPERKWEKGGRERGGKDEEEDCPGYVAEIGGEIRFETVWSKLAEGQKKKVKQKTER